MKKPELRVSYRNKELEKELKKMNEKEREKRELKEKILKFFETSKTFKPTKLEGEGLIPWPEGLTVEDPEYPWDIYGGGRKWVIDQKNSRIWEIINNGDDGDNWALNNIETQGAGAIGIYVPYTKELENIIIKYTKED